MTDHAQKTGTGHHEGADQPINAKVAQDVSGLNFPALIKSWTPFFVGLVLALVVTNLLWTKLVYSEKQQPFNFNHLIHIEEAGMDCDECHNFNANGRFSGIPATEKCLDCHTRSNPQNEENQKEAAFLEEYVTEDDELKKPIDWYVYSKQPDCVYFSHIAHVQQAEFGCEVCHEDHGATSVLPPYYENRITRYSKLVYENMKMTDCADCHKKHEVPQNNACFVCHK